MSGKCFSIFLLQLASVLLDDLPWFSAFCRPIEHFVAVIDRSHLEIKFLKNAKIFSANRKKLFPNSAVDLKFMKSIAEKTKNRLNIFNT